MKRNMIHTLGQGWPTVNKILFAIIVKTYHTKIAILAKYTLTRAFMHDLKHFVAVQYIFLSPIN